jgi:DNA ligase-1
MKPMLACDWDEEQQRFPVIAQPKIDGVRGLNMFGKLTGRSLKQFKNKHITQLFSHSALIGLDGEFAAQAETHPDLCRMTTSALGTIEGQPYVLWWLFDYVTIETQALPYHKRFGELKDRLSFLRRTYPNLAQHLRVVPSFICTHPATLHHFETEWLEQGYEGVILRDPDGLHKQGRSTIKEGGLHRIKRFVDFEFIVHTVIEGDENRNEAQTNELGRTFRTSHQANKVPNGMVGTVVGTILEDVLIGGEVLFAKGQDVTVSAGCMTHDQRRAWWEDGGRQLNAVVSKAKFFPKGIKDKPRFATWQGFRLREDMG